MKEYFKKNILIIPVIITFIFICCQKIESPTYIHNGNPGQPPVTDTELKGNVTIVPAINPPVSGTVLTADIINLNGSGRLFYQWNRKLGETTTPIGTDSQTYTVQAADEGAIITVNVNRSGLSGTVSSAGLAIALAIPSGSWQSALVSIDTFGEITYNPCPDGFIIPDFSYAGYKNGRPIPDYRPPASRIETIAPLPNANSCNAAHIQNAINKIAALQPDADGFRGVVQLGPGRYNMDSSIRLNADGIVLRGAGRGPDKATSALTESDLQTMTMLYRRGTGNALATNVVTMGASSAGSATWASGSAVETGRVNISTQKVMPGDMSFEVESAAAYSVGDNICIRYPTTTALLEALWYGGNSEWVQQNLTGSRWTTSNINIAFHRYITRIQGNRVTIDAPIYNLLDRLYSTAYMHKITNGTTFYNQGIEDLRISMDRTPETNTSGPEQSCIKMNALENSWATRLHLSDHIKAGVQTEATTRVTILDVRSVDHSGGIVSPNRYSFDNSHRSQLILIRDCLSREGRHSWVSNGTATVSGIAVVNHTAVNNRATASAEGHRYLSSGMLLDGWKDDSTQGIKTIGFFNRNNMGTNHGWGGVFSVLWNCSNQPNGTVLLDKIGVFGQNYSIGSFAGTVRRYVQSAPYVTGYNEGQNITGLYPVSLYDAQLRARMQKGDL